MDRKSLAEKHVKEIKERYPEEIQKSIEGSKVYRGDIDFPRGQGSKEIRVVLQRFKTDEAIIDALETSWEDYLVAALNFASYKWPGGGFIKGSMAQEEALCHQSTLYPVLLNFLPEYEKNREDLHDSLYTNFGVYSPGILFEGAPRRCSVITVPAPNRSATRAGEKAYHDALESRCKFVLDIAEAKGVDILILGAFGCGVFGGDPEETAKVFKKYIESGDYMFEEVVFAIPDSKNYEPFKRILG